MEIPPVMALLYKKGNKILKFDKKNRITLIPAEIAVMVYNKQLQGFFNHEVDSTHVLLINAVGPVNKNLSKNRYKIVT